MLWQVRRGPIRPYLSPGGAPRSLSELAVHSDHLPVGSLEDELNWEIGVVGINRSSIAVFLGRKAEFENQLWKGEATLAQVTLAELVAQHGWSLWALEATLLLAQLQGGSERRQQVLRDLTSDDVPPLIKVFGAVVGERIAGDISAALYDKRVALLSAQLNEDGTDDSFAFSVRLLFNFHGIKDWRPDHVAAAVSFFRRFSVVDRWIGLTRLLPVLAANSTSSPSRRKLISYVRRIETFIPGTFSSNLLTLLCPSEQTESERQRLLIELADAYTTGRYSEVAHRARAQFLRETDVVEYAELYARATSFLPDIGQGPEEGPYTPAENLLFAVQKAIRGTDGTDAARLQLLTVAYQYDCTICGQRIFALSLLLMGELHPLSSHSYRLAVGPFSSARSASAFRDSFHARAFLETLRSQYVGSPSVWLFCKLRQLVSADEAVEVLRSIPEYRRTKYEALALETAGEYPRAVEILEVLVNRVEQWSTAHVETFLALVRCQQGAGRHGAAVATAANYHVARPASLDQATLSKLVAQEPSSDEPPSVLAAYAVLLHAQRERSGLAPDAEQLFPAVDRTLIAAGVQRPSALRVESGVKSDAGAIPRNILVPFLRDLCTPEVLDSSIEYESSDDLEDERIAVCLLLQSLSNDVREDASREIERRSKAAEIRKLTRSATRSRVHVDTDGVRRSLGSDFSEGYSLMRRRWPQEDRIRQLVQQILSQAATHSEGRQLDILFTTWSRQSGSGLELFSMLFGTLRERFIASDEYGLDSYLSVRIRHGTLAGHLRGPFERQRIVTRREGNGGGYLLNEAWSDSIEKSVRDQLQGALADFSSRVDEIIEVAKNDWIQIRSPQRPEGIFNFAYSATELNALYRRLGELPDESAFVDASFFELWSRTSKCLTSVRNSIATLANWFMQALDSLDKVVHSFSNTAPPGLSRAIASSRTEIQQELKLVASWFEIRQAEDVDDYRMDVAVDAAAAMIRRSQNMSFRVTRETKGCGLLRGATLTHVFDIFQILFENVVRHSRTNPPAAVVAVEKRGSRMIIDVANTIPDEVDENALMHTADAIEQAASSGVAAVKREGGSGFAKLRKNSAV